ncbi:MAG TPA: TRAP transporter small permease subunit [Burkholderiales bacterium]|jgi:TRAP-type C4-dicarboxylate transport system permease small subunit|nr:TRAP transporter small permease subunit [Burkholderiales bacterium]
MRTWLDRLYEAAGWLAAVFMIGTLVFVLLGIFGRIFGFHVRGTDAYAGYCMAASGFLALAYTLRRNEHIRVTLLLGHVPPAARKALEIWCHAIAIALAAILAFYSTRLAWQSHTFNDISTANDATPLWIPQLAMAFGTAILLVAFVDAFVAVLRDGGKPSAGEEPARIE